MSDHNSRFKDNVEVGGLLLCSIPTEFADERIQGQAEISKNQMDAVDQSYLRESDPRMPVLRPERTSKTTNFGK